GGVRSTDVDIVKRTGGSRCAADGDGAAAQCGRQASRQSSDSEVAEHTGAARDGDGAAVAGLVHRPLRQGQRTQRRRHIDRDGVGAGAAGAGGVLHGELDIAEGTGGGWLFYTSGKGYWQKEGV